MAPNLLPRLATVDGAEDTLDEEALLREAVVGTTHPSVGATADEVVWRVGVVVYFVWTTGRSELPSPALTLMPKRTKR